MSMSFCPSYQHHPYGRPVVQRSNHVATRKKNVEEGKILSVERPYIQLQSHPSAVPSLRVLITVAVHGNEPCGMYAYNELWKEGYFEALPEHLGVEIMLGHPEACQHKVRFVEHNLNRLMRKDLFDLPPHPEVKRAQQIARAIDRSDIYLDLHSCSAPAPAHALPMDTAESIHLASDMPVGFVVQHLAHTTQSQGTTIDYALRKGLRQAVCVECGQHDERETIDNAKACIQAVIDRARADVVSQPEHRPVILMSTESEPVREQFRFSRPIQAFDCVPYGEEIARDIQGPILSPYKEGTYIVMPTHLPVVGEEAFFYAKLTTMPSIY